MALGIGLSVWMGRARRVAPYSLFAGGEGGAWLPTDVSTMFKTNTIDGGNVAANDDTIGMVLDQRLWAGASLSAVIAAQAELEVNGDFANTSGWTLGAGASIASGYLEQPSAGAGYTHQIFATVAGKWYRVNFQITQGTFYCGVWQNAPASALIVLFGQTNVGTHTAYFQALSSTATFSFIAAAGTTARMDNVSVKAVPGNHEYQETGSFRPKYKTGNYRQFDGVDDYLAGGAKCGASGNTYSAKVAIPATISATQVIAGMQASASTRFYLGVDTSGRLCAGVGSDSTATIVGTTDVRGLVGVVGLEIDGTNIKLFWNGGIEYSGARNGNPSTAIALYEGSLNNNGTSASFFAGGIYDSLFIQRVLTTAELTNLLRYWS